MTLPVMEPRRQVTAAVRHPFVWRSRDLSINARSGQTGTLVRASAGVADDSFATSRTCVHSQPRWHVTGGFTTLRMGGGVTEYLHWTVPLDATAFSFAVTFAEFGTIAVTDAVVFSIANSAFGTPRIYVAASASGRYALTHHNGTTAVSSTMGTAPVVGNGVILRGWLYGDGSVQLWQSINGAAETAGAQSSANTPASWSTPTRLTLNAAGTGNIGQNNFIGMSVMRGNQTQAKLLEPIT